MHSSPSLFCSDTMANRHGCISRIGGAPYRSKRKCFQEFVKRRTLAVWFKSDVDRTLLSCFFLFFWWNRLLLLNSEDYYERTLWNIAISLEYLYHIGPEIMCANFREIWRKYVGKVAKSVFWRKFKMAENLSWRKWAWSIWGDAPQPKESREKNNFDFPTYGSRVIGQNVKCAVIAPPWGRLKNV